MQKANPHWGKKTPTSLISCSFFSELGVSASCSPSIHTVCVILCLVLCMFCSKYSGISQSLPPPLTYISNSHIHLIILNTRNPPWRKWRIPHQTSRHPTPRRSFRGMTERVGVRYIISDPNSDLLYINHNSKKMTFFFFKKLPHPPVALCHL